MKMRECRQSRNHHCDSFNKRSWHYP